MAAHASRVYVVSLVGVSVSAAKTLIQIKSGPLNPLKLLRARLSQRSSTTTTMLPVQIRRKTATATGLTPFTPILLGPFDDPAAKAVGGATATGTDATGEGTDGDILVQDDMNYLNGFLWTPTQELEQIYVDAASGARGFIAMKLPVAPAAVTLSGDMFFSEF